MSLEVLNARTGKHVTAVDGLTDSSTVRDIKEAIGKKKRSLYADRQEIRPLQKSKGAKDTDTLASLNIKPDGTIYVKDLGPQISWTTVFLAEYAGPLLIYAYIYTRPWLFYGTGAADKPYSMCADLAVAGHSLHYLKRLLETIFVHRFSHNTMPIFNLFKNCSYYWLFTAYLAYHINHPLFTSPSDTQVYVCAALFLLFETGNFSIHIALRNLRPPGSTVRCIPHPTPNPLTGLFACVSCPNYTYEVASWLAFSAMTQCLPALLFALAGFYQMAMWALGKHRNYVKEFKDYPRGRKAIIPFVL